MAELIRTSLLATLTMRLSRVHDRARIGIFAGPPGIGKTTAVRAFAAGLEGAAAVVTVPAGAKAGVRSSAALQLVLEALYDLELVRRRTSYLHGYVELRARTYAALEEWSGGDPHARLTIILDEAQNLAEEAIEALRYLNDEGGGYSPFPVGLVFIGNNTFRLEGDRNGRSVMTDAVSDRALYKDTFSYDHVKDDDLALFMDERGVTDPEVHRILIRYLRSGRQARSFRRLADLLDDMREDAGGAEIGPDTVKAVLGL